MNMLSRGQDSYDSSEFTCKGYEYYLPLQILDGETILSRTIQNPEILQNLLEAQSLDEMKASPLSALSLI